MLDRAGGRKCGPRLKGSIMSKEYRNPARIPRILKRLEVMWGMYPEMRLGQLIGNIFHSTDKGGVRQYYIEDDEFMNAIEKGYTGVGRGKEEG